MPISVSCGVCQAPYNLKDELAGRQVRCARCQNLINVPAPVLMAVPADQHPAFHRDKFLLRQKHLALTAEKYYVWDEQGRTILYIERPAHIAAGCLALLASGGAFVVILGIFIGLGSLVGKANEGLTVAIIFFGLLLAIAASFPLLIFLSPKRHVTMYADDTKALPLLEILQDHKFYFLNATYTVNDPRGNRLGALRKNIIFDFVRKRWHGTDDLGNEIFLAKEDSIVLSLMRRLMGPMFGLLRTNFIIVKPDHETVIGEFNRKFTLLDRYVLDVSRDREGYLDRRLAVALGVMLDTGERR